MVKRSLFDRIFAPRRLKPLADAVKCERGHPMCLGPTVAANQGGCRMSTWSDVG